MSRLQQLIDELCPNGVEYKKIETICLNITSGGTPSSTNLDFYNGNIPWLRTQEVGYGDIYETGIKITQEGLKNSSAKMIAVNCVILAMYGATVGKVGINKIELSTNQACCNLEVNNEIINYKFLYYHLDSQYEYLKSLGRGSQTNISLKIIKKLKIPIPPLEVQEEIVRILDKFKELTAELTAELDARKKQYEYYFDKVLGIDKEREVLSFGDIAKIVRGASPRPIISYITDDPNAVNWIKIGDVEQGVKYVESSKQKITIEGAKKSRFVKEGDFIISNSMSFGRPYILATSGCVHDGWLVISDYEKTYSSDFLYYILTSSYVQKYFEMNASNGTVKNLNAEIVKNLMLPVYTEQEQEKIVNALTKFDAITIDVTQGLPAEIKSRTKQYNYYLNQLLKFSVLKKEVGNDKED